MKEIKFVYNNTPYTLAFTRESIKQMEQTGFDFSQADSKPISSMENLFYGSFAVHHRGIKRRLVSEIWESLDNKGELVEKLAEMVEESLADFMEGNGEESKKTQWEVVD